MPKITRVKELKPRIREIKEIEHDEKSELIEEIKEAENQERESVSSSTEFNAPSLMLQSNAEPQEQRTQIQQETRERREVDRINRAYTQTQQGAEEREYRVAETLAPDLFRERRIINQPQAPFTRNNAPVQTNKVQRGEVRRDNYETQQKKKKIYPWEA